MQTLVIKAAGSRNEIQIENTGKNFESIYNEIETAVRGMYENSSSRRKHGNKCFEIEASVGENRLIFGIGLSADKTGKIVWESLHSFDRISRGYLPYSRFVDGAFYSIVNLIIKFFGINDLINTNDSDREWEDLMDFADFENDEMAQMESIIEMSTESIAEEMEHCRNYVNYYLFPYNPDDNYSTDEIREWISESLDEIARGLKDIAEARGRFLYNMSNYTHCDFTLADAYSEFPEIDLYPYYSLLDNFDATDAFETILDSIFETVLDNYEIEGAEDLLSLRDLEFHYHFAA